jgi:ABC-type transporter MlaC component
MKLLILFTLFNLFSQIKVTTLRHESSTPKDYGVAEVISLIDVFGSFGSNRQDFLTNKIDYKKYKEEELKLANKASEKIDFFHICEESLKYDYDVEAKKFKGDHWEGKTNIEKEIFVNKFQLLIENIVYPIANDYFGSLKITHTVAKKTDTTRHIKSTIEFKTKRRDRKVETEWFLHNRNSKWQIYDVIVDEESWVVSFRSQFNDVITKKSYKELLELMDKKLKEVKEENEKKDKEEKEGKKVAEKE